MKRPEHMNLVDELARTAEAITWSRWPELGEFESMAELIVAEDFYDKAHLVDTSASKRTQLRRRLAEGKAGRARALRKILGPKQLATDRDEGDASCQRN